MRYASMRQVKPSSPPERQYLLKCGWGVPGDLRCLPIARKTPSNDRTVNRDTLDWGTTNEYSRVSPAIAVQVIESMAD